MTILNIKIKQTKHNEIEVTATKLSNGNKNTEFVGDIILQVIERIQKEGI